VAAVTPSRRASAADLVLDVQVGLGDALHVLSGLATVRLAQPHRGAFDSSAIGVRTPPLLQACLGSFQRAFRGSGGCLPKRFMRVARITPWVRPEIGSSVLRPSTEALCCNFSATWRACRAWRHNRRPQASAVIRAVVKRDDLDIATPTVQQGRHGLLLDRQRGHSWFSASTLADMAGSVVRQPGGPIVAQAAKTAPRSQSPAPSAPKIHHLNCPACSAWGAVCSIWLPKP